MAGARAPRHWVHDSAPLTCMAYALSAVFPVGERFFVNAVKQALPHIHEPELRNDAQVFMAQEGQHAHQHAQYNQDIDADGFPVQGITARMGRNAAWLQQRLPLRSQLALTAAFEHFTAVLSTQILNNPAFMGDMPEPHRSLWTHHAVEEIEHKATAFQVYQAMGGSTAHRLAWFLVATASFLTMTVLRTTMLLWNDGTLFQPAHHARAIRWALGASGLLTAVLPRWFAYLRPSFHPNDHDDTALIAPFIAAHGLAS